MRCLFITFLILLLLGCGSRKESVFGIPEMGTLWLAGDSVQTWKIAQRINGGTRMNMGDCFLSYRLRYFAKGTFSDNSDEHEGCGSTLAGTWQWKENKAGQAYLRWDSPQLPDVMHADTTYKYFKVLYLSPTELKISYQHTQYGAKPRLIIDTYVPDTVVVPDRNFHH